MILDFRQFDDIFADTPPISNSLNVEDTHLYLLAELMKLKPQTIQGAIANHDEALARIEYLRKTAKLLREHIVGMAFDLNQRLPITEHQDIKSFNNILSDISMDLIEGFQQTAERLMDQ